MTQQTKNSFLLYLIDLVLLNGAFFVMNALERGTWRISGSYGNLLLLMNVVWLLVSLLTRRWHPQQRRDLKHLWHAVLRTGVFMLFFTTVFVVLFDLSGFSRFHVLGTYGVLLLLEGVLLLIAGRRLRPLLTGWLPRRGRHYRVSPSLAVADFVLLVISFAAVMLFKYGTLSPPDFPVDIAILHAGLWLLAATWTGKLEKRQYPNDFYAYSPFFKAGVLAVALFSVFIFAGGFFYYSRTLVFAPVVLLLALEVPLSIAYMLAKKYTNGTDIESAEQVRAILKQEELDTSHMDRIELKTPVRERLQMLYLTEHPHLFSFLNGVLDLEHLEASACRVFHTHTVFNIKTLDNASLQLFVNLHKVNDFRRLNEYFLNVHRKLVNGGYLVGRKNTIDSVRERYFNRYPTYMAHVFYTLSFLYHRVCPKLPGVQKAYFVLSRGKSRVISKAELLGRLYFCGYRVLKVKTIGDSLYFIAQKIKTPCLDQNPSYGPLIRLKRVGYEGKTIYINKLRTMHPYSEYIQDYVYSHNNLDASGKLKNDFRVTEWGRVFRKLWIDELPQLINFVRGDVGLVGVRALSEHYFNLYPQGVRELRVQTKPGLVPPYYADMPDTFDEIVASERRYLERKLEKPVSTDVIYFCRAVYNIVVKKARSG